METRAFENKNLQIVAVTDTKSECSVQAGSHASDMVNTTVSKFFDGKFMEGFKSAATTALSQLLGNVQAALKKHGESLICYVGQIAVLDTFKTNPQVTLYEVSKSIGENTQTARKLLNEHAEFVALLLISSGTIGAKGWQKKPVMRELLNNEHQISGCKGKQRTIWKKVPLTERQHCVTHARKVTVDSSRTIGGYHRAKADTRHHFAGGIPCQSVLEEALRHLKNSGDEAACIGMHNYDEEGIKLCLNLIRGKEHVRLAKQEQGW
eukprot:gene3867-4410_t